MAEPRRGDVESWKQNPWSKLPTWAKWVTGVIGVLLLLGIGGAIDSGGEDDLEAELTDARAALARANGERDDAQAAADAVLARKQEIVGNAKAVAAGIVGSARSESAKLAGELNELRDEVDAAEGALAETESSLEGAEREEALSSFGDGIWQAETDYVPGTYRAPGGDGCYWATLGSADPSDIETNEVTIDASQQIATIESPYFQSKGCGTWERIGE
jgi:hypothetical protein